MTWELERQAVVAYLEQHGLLGPAAAIARGDHMPPTMDWTKRERPMFVNVDRAALVLEIPPEPHMPGQMTAAEFKARFGFEPQNDDVERTTCTRAGQFGHVFCGICPGCGMPRFACGTHSSGLYCGTTGGPNR